MSGSKATALIILLAAIFMISYWILVENPFTADSIDFKEFVRSIFNECGSSQEITLGSIPPGLIVSFLGSIAIWIIRRLLHD